MAVEDGDSRFAELGRVGPVPILVECYEEVRGIALAFDGVHGDPDLRPDGPAEDLGGECGEGVDVVSGSRGGARKRVRGRHDAAFAGETDDEVPFSQECLQAMDAPLQAGGLAFCQLPRGDGRLLSHFRCIVLR